MMDYFKIKGGRPLEGEIEVKGNKNEALPVLAAVLLTEEPVVLKNLPEIKDVTCMIEIIKDLGVQVKRLRRGEYEFIAKKVEKASIPENLAVRIRGSLLFSGALMYRKGEAIIPTPGGDKIGKRRVDTHLMALNKLGAKVEYNQENRLHFTKHDLMEDEAYIFLDEASVTATENILIYAASLEVKTVVYNAACEPHVQNLCRLLVKMGASIEGVGTNRLTIMGKDRLSGTEHVIGPDHIEIGSFIALAAATKSKLKIQGVEKDHMIKINQVFQRLGVRYHIENNDIMVPSEQELRIEKDFGGAVPKIDDGVWPAFPADLTSVMVVLATQCFGTVLVFEKMFEARLFFVDKLISMGANIVLCDPHRAVITGPNRLHGTSLSSPDIRAGMALLIASLCATGESKIYNINQIDRGYEDIENRLKKLGARVERVSSKTTIL